jgi:hypothetical protein
LQASLATLVAQIEEMVPELECGSRQVDMVVSGVKRR